MKASVLLDVIDGVGVGLVSGAPGHIAVQRSFWFGGAGEGHKTSPFVKYFT